MSRPAVTLLLTLAIAAAAPSVAAAYVEPGANLASASLATSEQSDDLTSQVTVSGDGKYALFATPARNLFPAGAALSPVSVPPDSFVSGGVFRRRLSDGLLELVAPGDLHPKATPATITLRGALNASTSRDGRYIAFSTGWKLVSGDTNGNIDVYVRDMTKAIDAAGAFQLVSALNGSDSAVAWDTPYTNRPGRNPGADVTPGRAISADGNKVVFRTDIVSNILDGADLTTPKGQVMLRDRGAKSTQLVARNVADGSPVGSSEYGNDPFNLARAPVISADGSSVAWIGRNAPSQVTMLLGESFDTRQDYILFRRVSDGDSAVTRRLLTVTDPDDTNCSADFRYVPDFYVVGPCYGPLGEPEERYGGLNYMIPSLSSDGKYALLTTNAPARNQLGQGNSADAWLVDTSSAVSRKIGALELTRDANVSHGGDPINAAALSADGNWAVLTTARSVYTLPSITAVDAPRLDASKDELYLIDLKRRSIERILRSPEGDGIDGAVVGNPAISDDGSVIAFLSDATNLFKGDANQQTDAFTVLRTDPPDNKPPVDPTPKPLNATLRSSRASSVSFNVGVPAAGALSIRLRARIPAIGRKPATEVVLGSVSLWCPKATNRVVTLKVANKYLGVLKSLRSLQSTALIRFTDVDGAPFQSDVDALVRR